MTEAEYRVGMDQLVGLLDHIPEEGTPARDEHDGDICGAACVLCRINELGAELERYELEQFPILLPTPEQVALFRAHEERRCSPNCEFC